MNHDETFTCEDCGYEQNIRYLRHRETMPGAYCPLCADTEKCGACGEMVPGGLMQWREDVRNYICENCVADYEEVAGYIKSLMKDETRIVELSGMKEIRKAS